VIHSDQGSQVTNREWQVFLNQHYRKPSMSHRGNCHDNTVAESFFHLPKRDRMRRRPDQARDAARQDNFVYIELF
jgi:putative transposase